MAHIFLDTCVVKYRYIKDPLWRSHRQKINRLLGNPKNTTYIADATILELASAFAGFCRFNRETVKVYDAMDRSFIQDLADSRFVVRPANKQLYILRARNLVRLGGIVHGRELGSTDALIASCALDLAHEIKERVKFLTSDKKLSNVLPLIDAFRTNLEIIYLPPPVRPPAPTKST